jgi:hypothetical protein
VWRPEGKRILEIPRCRKEDNIKMNLVEVGLEDMDQFIWLKDRDR